MRGSAVPAAAGWFPNLPRVFPMAPMFALVPLLTLHRRSM